MSIKFELSYGLQKLLVGDQEYVFGNEKTGRIQTLRFYISGIALYNDEQLQWKETNSYHLIDASIPATLVLQQNAPAGIRFNTIKFKLGIDSTTNVSGAMGGDLDPSKGMYWSWQSGYINFKLEGTSTACKTRNNEFHFHLGGYAYPFASLQEVTLKTKRDGNIIIHANVEKFLKAIDLSVLNDVMIPGTEAVHLSEQAATIFSVKE